MEDVLRTIPPELCVACKGHRKLCGIDPCPLLARVKQHLPKSVPVGKSFTGTSPPAMFVGRHGYPKISIGPMLSTSHLEGPAASLLDSPKTWFDDLTIPDVVGLRGGLVRTMHQVDVSSARNPDRFAQISQELSWSSRQIDTEVTVRRLPTFTAMNVGEFSAPHGPTVGLEKAQLTENVSISNPIDRAINDTDQPASNAIVELGKSGVTNYQIEKLFSSGSLGVAARRRFVPTRWAITGTDDTIGKRIIERLADFGSVPEPVLFSGGGFGNLFTVLILPGSWGFDYVEAWSKGSLWAREEACSNDFEDHRGRSDYAVNTAGGYYAARLGVLEWMERNRLRGTAIVWRKITSDYTTPLGVWVVREACRNAMDSIPIYASNIAEGLNGFEQKIGSPSWRIQFGYLDKFLAQSRLDSFR